ncbi:MAG TPA: protein phosphatase 2C domain-containing protein [Solirubrobacterales bacterium]|nr:protein phosphatase 2C domain-containing protein [Solirubrobacterales bacterium]
MARRGKGGKKRRKEREADTDPRPPSQEPPRSEPPPRPSEPPPSSGEPPSRNRPEAIDPEAKTQAIRADEPVTETDPAPRAPRSEPPPKVEREEPRPAELSPRPAAGRGELPEPPKIGRVSQSWRRRLAESGWPRPGYAADGGEVGPFSVLAASAVGQGHLHRGVQRQDAYHFAPAGTGAVVAVADGVSQMPLSALGAEVAAFSAVREYAHSCGIVASAPVAERPGPAELLADAVDIADAEVRRLAADLSIEPRELSTTLMVAALEPGQGDEVHVTIGAVGNSSAFEIASEGPPAVLAGPGSEDPSADYGEFLPATAGTARIDRALLRPGATLLLATDGLAEDLVTSASVRRWLWERLTYSRTPLEFAHALSYRRQGSMDDLTALAAWRW